MSMLLSFVPFIAFALCDRLLGTVGALWLAAGLAALVLLRDALAPGRTVKLLEIGTVLLFGGLGLWAVLGHTQWPVLGVRLRVDAGLLLVVLVSLAVRQPFTLQYAKEQTPPEVWTQPGFLLVNDILTGVWALAFALMVTADLLMLYVPGVPLWVGIVVTVAAIVGAVQFTRWYPAHMQAKVQAPS